MKRNLLFWITGLLLLTRCSSNDDIIPNNAVTDAFKTKFPTVEHVEWEKKKLYNVANFVLDMQFNSAWFNEAGIWYMTDTDLDNLSQLPLAVQTAFKTSRYKDWEAEGFQRLERLNTETIYVIEVEKGNLEIDLFYSADGVLIKAVPDFDNDNDYDDFLPNYIAPAAIKIYITQNYTGARIVDVENKNGMIEVDIIHDNKGKEVFFNTSYEWIQTEYDVATSEVEASVSQALASSIYKDYLIDDIEKHETPNGNYYVYELEKGNIDVDIKITTAGVITVLP